MAEPLRVAAICTIYYAHSHADAIVTKFLKGMSIDEVFFPPEVEVVSLYVDHILETDIGTAMAAECGVPIYPSIQRALHAGSQGPRSLNLPSKSGNYSCSWLTL